MKKHSLTTRSKKSCPQCGEQLVLADEADTTTTRPLQINLMCPECHFPGRATLGETNQVQSIFPSPDAASPLGVAQDNAGWLTEGAVNPQPFFRLVPKRRSEHTQSARVLN